MNFSQSLIPYLEMNKSRIYSLNHSLSDICFELAMYLPKIRYYRDSVNRLDKSCFNHGKAQEFYSQLNRLFFRCVQIYRNAKIICEEAPKIINSSKSSLEIYKFSKILENYAKLTNEISPCISVNNCSDNSIQLDDYTRDFVLNAETARISSPEEQDNNTLEDETEQELNSMFAYIETVNRSISSTFYNMMCPMNEIISLRNEVAKFLRQTSKSNGEDANKPIEI